MLNRIIFSRHSKTLKDELVQKKTVKMYSDTPTFNFIKTVHPNNLPDNKIRKKKTLTF
jgi:hypothetical protein